MYSAIVDWTRDLLSTTSFMPDRMHTSPRIGTCEMCIRIDGNPVQWQFPTTDDIHTTSIDAPSSHVLSPVQYGHLDRQATTMMSSNSTQQY